MKKMMIAVTTLSALLCTALTGCTVNVSDETMSQVADVAVAVAENADITVNGQPVDISVDSNGNVNVNLAQTTAGNNTAAVQSTTTAAVQQQTPASDAKITDAVITALSGEGDGYMSEFFAA